MIQKLKSYLTEGKTAPQLMKTFLVYGLISLSLIITKVLLAHLYGQKELGVFTYFFGLVSVVFLFASWGIPEALTQVIVKEPQKTKKTIIYSLLLTLPLTVVVSLPFLFTDFFLTPELKLSFFLYLVTYTFFYLVYCLFRGYRKFVEGSWYSLVNRLFFIFFIILLSYFSVSFSWLILSLSLALALATLISLPQIILLARDYLSPEKIKLKDFLRLAFSLFLMQAGLYLLREMDLVIIPYLTDFNQLGLYSAHSSISNVIRLVAYVFPVVMVPLAAINQYKLRESLTKIIKILIPFSLLVLLATYLLVPLLYGQEYRNNLLPLFLVLSSSLLVVYSYFNSILVGENKCSPFYFKMLTLDFLLSLILNTGLIIIFVKYIGIIGAPLATAITIILKILLNTYGIKKMRRNKHGEIYHQQRNIEEV